jgi:hypothetical protein
MIFPSSFSHEVALVKFITKQKEKYLMADKKLRRKLTEN